MASWFVEASANFGGNDLYSRERTIDDLQTVLLRLACIWLLVEQIPYKPNVMIDMTKFCSLISLWMTLTFTTGHVILRQLELMQLLIFVVSGMERPKHLLWLMIAKKF